MIDDSGDAQPDLDWMHSLSRTSPSAGGHPPALQSPPPHDPERQSPSVSPPLPSFSYADERNDYAMTTYAFRDARRPVPSDRLQYSPWVSICLLDVKYRTGKRRSATGFLINPYQVATSAHVLRFPDDAIGVAEKIKVTPGYLQPPPRQQSQTSDKFRYCVQWGSARSNFLGAYDYGVVHLDNPAKFQGFGKLSWVVPSAIDFTLPFMVSGYPVNIEGQWWASGNVVGAPGQLAFRHSVQTSSGQSGSPFFCVVDNRVLVAGIHSKESSDHPGENIARRVTSDMIYDYERWGVELGGGRIG